MMQQKQQQQHYDHIMKGVQQSSRSSSPSLYHRLTAPIAPRAQQPRAPPAPATAAAPVQQRGAPAPATATAAPVQQRGAPAPATAAVPVQQRAPLAPATAAAPVQQRGQSSFSSSCSFRWNTDSYAATPRVDNNTNCTIPKDSDGGRHRQQQQEEEEVGQRGQEGEHLKKVKTHRKKKHRGEVLATSKSGTHHHHRHHHHHDHGHHHKGHKRHSSSSKEDGIKKSRKIIDINNSKNDAIPLKRRCSEAVPSLSELVANHNKPTTPINNIRSLTGRMSTTTTTTPIRTPLPPLRSVYHHQHQQGQFNKKAAATGGSSNGSGGGVTSNGFAPKYVPKGEHADKRSKTIGHTNECPVKHKWVVDGSSTNSGTTTTNAQRQIGGAGGGGCCCPVCSALLEPHATRAKENNLRLLTTAIDVSPDTKTITLRYGCRYGHKFTQQQDVSAPYDKPLSCPHCRLAKAPSPPPSMRSTPFKKPYRNNNHNNGVSRGSGGCIDPLIGMSARDRQAAALKAARLEYEASLHKGISPMTIENSAKINKLVAKLKAQVPSTREQVVLGIVECPHELGLWTLLRTLLDLHPQPGQTEVDRDRLYRRAALLCHPDKCDHERAKEAFAKLSAEYASSSNK